MPDLSEFIAFIAEKSGIERPDLVEKDLIIHRILREISSSHLAENYLFKGGSCLVKCYFSYYRFSVDRFHLEKPEDLGSAGEETAKKKPPRRDWPLRFIAGERIGNNESGVQE